MRYFQDLLLLLIYSLSAVLFIPIRPQLIAAFLLALILLCSCYFLEIQRLRLLFCLLYFAAAAFFPDCFYFYPVVVCLLLKDSSTLPAILGSICYLYRIFFFTDAFPVQPFFGTIELLLAFLLQKRSREYEELYQKFHNSQDDSRELNLLLSEKNQSLLEKQDFEIYTATLRERNRIAREIHDNVGHMLSRSILMIGALKTINQETALDPMLDNLDDSLNCAMDSIRTSVHDLHDESVNLEESIQSMIQDFAFCPVTLTYDMGREVPKEVKYCFISIVKEALSNIMKHSSATHASIIMREHPALYQLCIEDNGTPPSPDCSVSPGHGLSPRHDLSPQHGLSPADSGMGLSNMLERTRSLNGTFQVIRENGFKIFITIPV